MEQDLISTPITRLACSKCAHEMDVAGREAFSQIECAKCGTRLTIPVMLGQFMLVEKMGSGGMGAVFRALDTALNRFVAIKVMKATLGEDNKLVQSFISEAQAAAALNHRNIVQIYSCGQEKGQPYIVMELVTGGKMNHMFSRDEPMDEVRLLKIAVDVAEGLKAANEVGLVHGDIKPENILIDQAGTAKIVDFGLAQFVNAQKERGEIWGTPYYISPERARGNKADHRSDIYSLGATMFHSLSGQPPFDGKTAADVVLARLKHPPPNLKELRPQLQTQTVELIDRMMAADPYLRYPNSASLKTDMHAALNAAKEAKNASKQKQKKSRPHLIIAGIAILVFGALGFGALNWYRGEKKLPPPKTEKAKPKPPKPKAAEKAKPEEEPKDEIFSVEEIKGKDGKTRLRMTVTFFSPEEEAKVTEALTALNGEDLMVSFNMLEALGKSMPRNSARAMWIPVLQVLPLWAAGDDAQAREGLAEVLGYKIKEKDGHPVYMPQAAARYLLGELDEAEMKKLRQEWPSWYGDLVNLLSGVRDLQAGTISEAQDRLNVYTGRTKAEPDWVYASRPAVEKWMQYLLDWEDVKRQVVRLLAAGRTEQARIALDTYKRDVPAMLAGPVENLLKEAGAVDAQKKMELDKLAASRHRMAVQQDLDRVDKKLTELSTMIVRGRDYRKASLSMSTLPSDMKTDQGREAAKWMREVIDRLDGLKNYIQKSAEVLPYNRADGSDLGGDVISASSLGVRVSLDGRSISTRTWDSIPGPSFLRLADFYAGSTRFDERERAEAYVSMAVFCLISGAFEPAESYASKAAELYPELIPQIRRLLPGLIRDS